MAERPNKNVELRSYDSFGYQYSFSVSDPMMNGDGSSVFGYYGFTNNKDMNMSLFSESGNYHIHNDKTIEMICGTKASAKDVSLVVATVNGDITVTCMKNGNVKIKGQNIMLQADEDIDVQAGRNINLIAKNGSILIDGQDVSVDGLTGCLVEQTIGSWMMRVFEGSYVGLDFLEGAGTLFGIGDAPLIGEAVSSLPFFSAD